MFKKRVNLYSAEKYDLKKSMGMIPNGSFSITITANTEDELEEQERYLKKRQKEKNEEYNIHKKKSERKIKNIEPYTNQLVNQPSTQPEELNKNEDSNISSVSLSITNFKVNLMKNTGNSIVIFGSSKAGKSNLMSYLYTNYFGDSNKYISTLFSINYYNTIYSKSFDPIIYKGWNKNGNDYIQLQRKINMETKNRYKFLEMFDDIIAVNRSNIVNNLILTLRNANISSILCLQYPRLLSKMARANANFIMFFRFNSEETIEDAVKVFLGSHFRRMGYKSLESQIDLYKELTKDYQFLMLEPSKDILSLHKISKQS